MLVVSYSSPAVPKSQAKCGVLRHEDFSLKLLEAVGTVDVLICPHTGEAACLTPLAGLAARALFV